MLDQLDQQCLSVVCSKLTPRELVLLGATCKLRQELTQRALQQTTQHWQQWLARMDAPAPFPAGWQARAKARALDALLMRFGWPTTALRRRVSTWTQRLRTSAAGCGSAACRWASLSRRGTPRSSCCGWSSHRAGRCAGRLRRRSGARSAMTAARHAQWMLPSARGSATCAPDATHTVLKRMAAFAISEKFGWRRSSSGSRAVGRPAQG